MENAGSPAPRVVLPRDLPAARFCDQELKRLPELVLAEQQSREGTQPIPEAKPATKVRIDDIPVSLATGKRSAIRAEFKAELQINGNSGFSQSDSKDAGVGCEPARRKVRRGKRHLIGRETNYLAFADHNIRSEAAKPILTKTIECLSADRAQYRLKGILITLLGDERR
jgi:hypothetical protein